MSTFLCGSCSVCCESKAEVVITRATEEPIKLIDSRIGLNIVAIIALTVGIVANLTRLKLYNGAILLTLVRGPPQAPVGCAGSK